MAVLAAPLPAALNSKSVRGRWLLLTGCVSSDKSAMAS